MYRMENSSKCRGGGGGSVPGQSVSLSGSALCCGGEVHTPYKPNKRT